MRVSLPSVRALPAHSRTYMKTRSRTVSMSSSRSEIKRVTRSRMAGTGTPTTIRGGIQVPSPREREGPQCSSPYTPMDASALRLLASLSAELPDIRATEPTAKTGRSATLKSPRRRDALRMATEPRAIPGRVLLAPPPTPVGPVQPLITADGGMLMANVCLKSYEMVWISSHTT